MIDGTLDQQRIKYTYDLKGNLLKTSTETRFLVHCKFGWEEGKCDGYYYSGVFALKDGPATTEKGIDADNPGKDPLSDFDWRFRIIKYCK